MTRSNLDGVGDSTGVAEDISSTVRKSAFGDAIVVQPTRKAHILPTNGLTSQITVNTFNTGTVDTVSGMLRAKTGTGAFAFAAALSDSIPYKTGSGIRGDFTAKFYGPNNLSQQLAGFITATDGPCFAYDDYDDGLGGGSVSTYGILYRHNGENEIQELLYTVAATGAETVTVRVNGDDYSVDLTAGTLAHNAYETALSLSAEPNLGLFQITQNDDTVLVFGNVARPPDGTFTFTGGAGTAVAAFTEILEGSRPVENFTPKSEWDDPYIFPGFDPTKLNVYSIALQYLGAGNMFFYIEDSASGHYKLVHTIQYAGLNDVPSLADPNMRVGVTAALLGSTTDISVQSSSIAGFIDGGDSFTADPRFLGNTVISVGTTDVNLLTIRNRTVRGTRANRIIIHIVRVNGFTESTKGAKIKILRDATVAGETDFQYVDKDLSIIEYDTDGTTVTGGTEIQELEIPIGGSAELNGTLDIQVHPGESITFAGSVRKTPSAEMDVTVEVIEDL